jgi:hypothetical protein
MQLEPFTHEVYEEECVNDVDFGEVYQQLKNKTTTMNLNRMKTISKIHCCTSWESFASHKMEGFNSCEKLILLELIGHFGIGKQWQIYRGMSIGQRCRSRFLSSYATCVMCSTSKPSNRNLGLYMPLPVPNKTMGEYLYGLVGGVPMTRQGHDYLFVIVDRFNKMCAYSMQEDH